MVLKELLRPSDGLANRSFCGADISMVQVKSNWKVGKKPLAFDYKLVWKSRINFFNGWFRNSFISKEKALKEPLDDVIFPTGNW